MQFFVNLPLPLGHMTKKCQDGATKLALLLRIGNVARLRWGAKAYNYGADVPARRAKMWRMPGSKCGADRAQNVAQTGLKMWRRPGSKCGTDRAQNVAHAGLKMWRRRGLRCSISKKQLLKTLINSRKLADVLTCSHDKVYLYMYLIPNSSVWQQSAASKPQLGNRTDCGITTTGVQECYFDCITR